MESTVPGNDVRDFGSDRVAVNTVVFAIRDECRSKSINKVYERRKSVHLSSTTQLFKGCQILALKAKANSATSDSVLAYLVKFTRHDAGRQTGHDHLAIRRRRGASMVNDSRPGSTSAAKNPGKSLS